MRATVPLAAALFLLCAPARAEAPPSDDGGRFLPSVAASAGRHRDQVFGSGWLGVAALPSSDAFTPFFAAGAAIDVRRYELAPEPFTTVTFGPELRCGISWFPDANRYLSALNVYALGGYRAPSVFNSGAARFGLGVSSPLAGVAVLTAKLFVPWMAEVTADVTAEGPEIAWRLGVAY